MSEGTDGFVGGDKNIRLLRALAEELRQPLLQIARGSELAQSQPSQQELKNIETTADAALRLIDSYLLSTQLLLGQQQLPLTPVSLGATMYDTAQHLKNLAKLYNCDIDITVKGNVGLTMAHPEGLQAALTSLAYSFIGARFSGKKRRVILTAAGNEKGVSAGVMSTDKVLAKDTLTEARQLFGTARRPLSALTHNNGAGVFVADYLFSAMNAPLRVTTRRSTSGLTAMLLPSRQLALL